MSLFGQKNKILKTQIVPVISALREKTEREEMPKIVKYWLQSFSLCALVLLEEFLFEKKITGFGYSVKGLNKEKIENIIKIYSSHFMCQFIRNKDVEHLMQQSETTEDKLREDVFYELGYSENDLRHYAQIYTKGKKEKGNVYILVYRLINKIISNEENTPDLIAVEYHAKMLSAVYSKFIKQFSKLYFEDH